MPKVLIGLPKVLHTYEGKSIISLGVLYRFLTVRDVPGDYLQISYTAIWDESCTCLEAIMKSIAWI